jgi:hypothetical protein
MMGETAQAEAQAAESVSLTVQSAEETKTAGRTNLLSSLPNLLSRARFSKRPHSPVRSKNKPPYHKPPTEHQWV